MTKTTLSLASIALTISSLQAAKPAPVAKPPDSTDRSLEVRIYNYAGVEAEELFAAAEIAQVIYGRSGVDTTWILCELPGVESAFSEACEGLQRPDTLQMRIVAKAPKKQTAIDASVFGFALPQESGFGTMATAFWDRIVERAAESTVSAHQLLGLVMAHEAGHLLLGFNSHSGHGLMSAHWDEVGIGRVAQGHVSFIGKQKKRIQAAAAERLLAASRR